MTTPEIKDCLGVCPGVPDHCGLSPDVMSQLWSPCSRSGLREEAQMELTCHDDNLSLDQLISMAIRLDNLLWVDKDLCGIWSTRLHLLCGQSRWRWALPVCPWQSVGEGRIWASAPIVERGVISPRPALYPQIGEEVTSQGILLLPPRSVRGGV